MVRVGPCQDSQDEAFPDSVQTGEWTGWNRIHLLDWVGKFTRGHSDDSTHRIRLSQGFKTPNGKCWHHKAVQEDWNGNWCGRSLHLGHQVDRKYGWWCDPWVEMGGKHLQHLMVVRYRARWKEHLGLLWSGRKGYHCQSRLHCHLIILVYTC